MKDKAKFIKRCLTTAFFTGLIAQVLAVMLYRDTVIDWKILGTIWLITGVIGQRFTGQLLKEFYDTTSYLMQLFFSACSFGGTLALLMLAINRYIPCHSEIESMRLPIVVKGHVGRVRGECQTPYVRVIIGRTEKQILFSCDTDIEPYNTAVVTVKKGAFGFYIIYNKSLER